MYSAVRARSGSTATLLLLDSQAATRVQVIPYLRQFLSTVGKLPFKPRAENVAKMRAWLERMQGLAVYAVLGEEERDQMRLDLEALIADVAASNG